MPLLPFQLLPHAKSQREWVCVSPESSVGPLRGVPWEACSFFHCPNPHWFLQPEVMGTYLPVLEPWARWSGLGLGSLTPEVSLPSFIHHMNVGPTVLLLLHFPVPLLSSLPLLLIWMNVTSLNLWLLNYHTGRFSDESGWYLFCSLVVIFAVVMWGVKACLPTPPSWLEVSK